MIKSRKSEIKAAENHIQKLLKKSKNLENEVKEGISKTLEETKKLREEFLKIDGIQEIQIKKRIKRKGSMDSPTKKWGSSRLKIKKGEGNWELEGKSEIDPKKKSFAKRFPKRSSTYVEDEETKFKIESLDKKGKYFVFGKKQDESYEDKWDFGEDEHDIEKELNKGGDSSFNSFDDEEPIKKEKSSMENRTIDWRKRKKDFYFLKSDSNYQQTKSKKKKNGNFYSRSGVIDDPLELMDESEDEKVPFKLIPTKLNSTKTRKKDLIKLYKKLMPEAKKMIKKLKRKKEEVLKINNRISEFIDKLDNNLNQKYRCKRCFKRFIISENKPVRIFL